MKHFKAGDIARTRKSFMDWRKPPEIKEQREKERDLFFDGSRSNDGMMSEWTTVKPNGYIDWLSGRKNNVETILRAALSGQIPASDKVIVERERPGTIA